MIEVNDTMRERMAAGLSFLYTTRDGHEWYIDSTLRFPFRQVDFAECMYDAYDGHDFEAGFPDLSTCQYALEEGCPQWRGRGWYRIGNIPNDGADVEPPRADWIGSIVNLKLRVAYIRAIWDAEGVPWVVDYCGSGSEPL